MKKGLLVLILLFVPIFVLGAQCNTEKHEEYIKYANKITYDNSYSKSSGRFSVILYNVIDGLKVKYNNHYYPKTSDDRVFISDVAEGTEMRIEIYDDENCDVTGVIYIDQLYF